MKSKFAGMMLGLSLAAGISSTASAGDMIDVGPGVKLLRGTHGVPVPAPQPVPFYSADWYFRIDAALGFRGAGGFHEDGYRFGHLPGAPGTNFRTRPSWFSNNDDAYAGFGVGVGYYFSSRWRGDITVDTRSEIKNSVQGRAYTYLDDASATQNGTYSDSTSLRSVPVLFNLYYDFGRHYGFKPYIGGGIGFAVNELERSVSVEQDTGGSGSARTKTHDVTLAAAASVGLTYDINPTVALDLNYRFLYVGGTSVDVGLAGQTTNAVFGDQTDHQLRAGVRLNVF